MLAYDQSHAGVLAWSATLLFGSAVPLVIWVVTAYRRLEVRAPGPLMGIAALAMLATLTLLTPVLYPLLPIGRFGGLIWLLVVSAMLPATRRSRTTAAAAAKDAR
ncbi:MAG: hypothetical protein ACR2G2_19065 [Pseudonocardia sp.]